MGDLLHAVLQSLVIILVIIITILLWHLFCLVTSSFLKKMYLASCLCFIYFPFFASNVAVFDADFFLA